MAVGTVSTSTSDNWQLITSITTSSGTSSTISSTISGYKKLMVVWNISGNTDNSGGLWLRFNNDSSGNYGGVASLYSTNILNGTTILPISGYFYSTAVGYVVIKDTDKTTPKTIEAAGGNATVGANGIWIGSSAVSRIDIGTTGGSFTGGTVYLYGIAA